MKTILLISSKDENSMMKKFFLKIPGCDDVNEQDVGTWLIADDPEFNMNDDEIFQSVLHNLNNTPSLEEIEESEEKFSFPTVYVVL